MQALMQTAAQPAPEMGRESFKLATGVLAPAQLFGSVASLGPLDGMELRDLTPLFTIATSEQDLSGLSWLSILVVVIALLGTQQRPVRQMGLASLRAFGRLRKTSTPPPVVWRDEFFANAAHEIRTPLATIKASAEVLADVGRAHLPETLHRLVLNIDHEAERLATLVDDLLDYEVIRAARNRPRFVPFDLREIVDRALDSVWPLARQREQTLSPSVPDDPVCALVDPELLERAIVNLVVNAVKYGSWSGQVALTLSATSSHAVFTIRDDGPGVPVEDLERIFERFYRSPGAERRRVQGSGLGLPICRAAVELHRGRVWVERPPEGGSLFKVELPLLVGGASARGRG
jgi:signal transduction histidine kinase